MAATVLSPGRKTASALPYSALLAPEPVSPVDGAPVDGSAAVFTWEAVPDATAYWLQVAVDPDFRRLSFDAAVGDTTSLTLYATLPEDGTPYYWRLRAGDGTDWYAWSAAATLRAVGIDQLTPSRQASVIPTVLPAAPPAVASAVTPAGTPAEDADALAPYQTGTTSQQQVVLFVLLFALMIATLALILVLYGEQAPALGATTTLSGAVLGMLPCWRIRGVE